MHQPYLSSVHPLRQTGSIVGKLERGNVMSGRARNNKLPDEPRLFQTGETDGRHAPCITSLASLARQKMESFVMSGKCFLSFSPAARAPSPSVVNQVSISQQERVSTLVLTDDVIDWQMEGPGDAVALIFL